MFGRTEEVIEVCVDGAFMASFTNVCYAKNRCSMRFVGGDFNLASLDKHSHQCLIVGWCGDSSEQIR